MSIRRRIFVMMTGLCLGMGFIRFVPNRIGLKVKFISSSNKLQESESDIDVVGLNTNTIFCNREMHCAKLEAIGFDMDFTLAQYNEEFDLLAFNGARAKLHSILGYPENVLDIPYSSTTFRRGLIIDKKRGNILKVDRYKYARTAYHGLRELERDERKATYIQSFSQAPNFASSNYVNIDTLFLLVDAHLFAYLVDMKDRNIDDAFFAERSYEDLYKDVRHCVDLCHRDGAIQDTVMRDPARFIVYDKQLVPMLTRYKSAGKKIFLLTNSFWDYTKVVMDYLFYGEGENLHMKWEDVFDVTIVGACKPGFLTESYMNIYRVDESGSLSNIEDKDAELVDEFTNARRIFQGGYWKDLHQLLGISKGESILYVGDHMYSDVAKSKRILGWRTCLIIPELHDELSTLYNEHELATRIKELRQLQYDLDEYIDLLRQRRQMGVELDEKIKEAKAKAKEMKITIQRLSKSMSRRFNPRWGQLFKAGFHDSRFASQVNDYACIYTSKASNLGLVAPNRPFRPASDLMPHDQTLVDSEYKFLTT